MLRKFGAWLFSSPAEPTTPGRIITWWEVRRIPYNIFFLCVGFLSLLAFFFFIDHAHVLKPGEDAEEPLGIIAAPILMNLCYTSGWVVEGALRILKFTNSRRIGVFLFKAGCAFSLFVVMLPSVYWGGYCLLERINVIRR
jgi:hypothetical protein